MAFKLISSFIEPGSRYETGGLSTETREALWDRDNGKDFLVIAKHEAALVIFFSPVLKCIVENHAQPISDLSRLETCLQDCGLRAEIVNHMLSTHSDGIVMIRFVSAVNDCQNTTNEDEKLFKARRIVALFVQDGSKFQILGIPIEMLKSRFENLLLVKELVLEKLLENPIVYQFLKSAEVVMN